MSSTEEEAAAVRIQAIARGKKERKDVEAAATRGVSLGKTLRQLDAQKMEDSVEIQFNGTGKFYEGVIVAQSGILTLNAVGQPEAIMQLEDLKVGPVTTERKGHPFSIRISLNKEDALGNYKYIVDCKDAQHKRDWLLGLQDRIAAHIERLEAEMEGEEPSSYPNMVFIPLKTVEPVVDAPEFVRFLVLLTIFMWIITFQGFASDFSTNDGLKSMTGMWEFSRISRTDDYVAWWAILLGAMRRWSSSRPGWAPTGPQEEQMGAVLVGLPYITQTKQLDLNGTSPTTVLPMFEPTAGSECPWAPINATDEQLAVWPDTTEGCYGATMQGEAAYYIPQMQGILNGSIDWSPADWISSETLELSHRISLYYPNERRFALIQITVSIDASGMVRLADMDGNTPSFETHEPFAWDNDPIFTTVEVCFYIAFAALLVSEIFEIWECVCMAELLLPMQVLTSSLELQLREIEYFHERASEVYDPRDPQTQKAFDFPDLADLKAFQEGSVQDCEDKVEALENELQAMKKEMRKKRGLNISRSDYENMRKDMVDLQLRLIAAASKLSAEERVSATAAMLQLACMWENEWSFDFPEFYLAELGADSSIAEDGVEAFKDINWIDVARAYIAWYDDTEQGSNLGEDTLSMAKIAESLKFKMVGLFTPSNENKVNLTPQTKIFAKISGLMDYLDMLCDVLNLHSQLVSARMLKYWNGPKGADLGSTVSRAFQKQIAAYNNTGKLLKEEMHMFPAEIAEGFTEPDMMKAETVKIKAKALHADVMSGIETCGILGLFFPGSPMWEIQRKQRLGGKHNKSKALWASLKSFGLAGSVVSDSSMVLYVQAGDVQEIDFDDEEDGVLSASSDRDMDFDNNPLASNDAEAKPPFSPVSAGMLSPRSRAAALERGTRDWRTWIPPGGEMLVNYDGQFICSSDGFSAWKKRSAIFPMYLWLSRGIKTYLGDAWNCIEFIMSLVFLLQFFYKVRMLQMASVLDVERVAVQEGTQQSLDKLLDFAEMNSYYMWGLTTNAVLIWIKLFKFLGVIPQMGVLLKVLGAAGPSVMIFTLVAMVPCIGLSLAYHVAFGHAIKEYSTMAKALNTLMRMAVGDFDFDLIYSTNPTVATVLFWASSLLITVVLTNIFIAIIMSAYDAVLAMNPDAADASSFVSMVVMQASRIVMEFFGVKDPSDQGDEIHPHVLENDMERIDDEAYCE
jgi:hypothetical protein